MSFLRVIQVRWRTNHSLTWTARGEKSSYKRFRIEDPMLSMCSLLWTTTSRLFFLISIHVSTNTSTNSMKYIKIQRHSITWISILTMQNWSIVWFLSSFLKFQKRNCRQLQWSGIQVVTAKPTLSIFLCSVCSSVLLVFFYFFTI